MTFNIITMTIIITIIIIIMHNATNKSFSQAGNLRKHLLVCSRVTSPIHNATMQLNAQCKQCNHKNHFSSGIKRSHCVDTNTGQRRTSATSVAFPQLFQTIRRFTKVCPAEKQFPFDISIMWHQKYLSSQSIWASWSSHMDITFGLAIIILLKAQPDDQAICYLPNSPKHQKIQNKPKHQKIEKLPKHQKLTKSSKNPKLTKTWPRSMLSPIAFSPPYDYHWWWW